MKPRGARRAGARLPAAIALALLMAAPAPAVRGGDAALAKFLLQGGKEDLGKRQYADALKKLDRACEEDATLIEAAYWAGAACEGAKDSAGALTRYRAFRAAFGTKRASGGASKDDTALAAKAQARIDALAPSEPELRKMTDGYAAELMAFAKAGAARDPQTAVRALRILLDVRPDDPDAVALLRKLDPSSAPVKPPADPKPAVDPKPAPPAADAAPADPWKAVKTWTNLVDPKAWGSQGGWRFSRDVLTVDYKAGVAGFPPVGHPQTGTRFVLEAEMRWLEERPGGWGMGLPFGKVGDTYYCFFLAKGRFAFFETHEVGGELFVKDSQDIDAIDAKAWHKISVVVIGDRAEGWLDGKKVLERTAPPGKDWNGDYGVWVQHSKVEVRGARFGKVP